MIVAMGDLHCGSTVALCPPEGIELDDGGRQMPNPIQFWLWKLWRETWDEHFPRIMDTYQPDTLRVVLNGDLVDGVHHNSPQLAPLVGQHFRAALTCLERGPLPFEPSEIHMIRGTESHVGRSGELEEGIARALRAEGHPMVDDPDTAQVSSFWRRLLIDDVLIDCRHHGRAGQRTHTKDAYQRLYAHDIWEAHVRAGERPPDLCIRSHHHRFADSGRIHDMPTRVVTLPAWQVLTAFGHRIAIEDLGHIGVVVFVVRDGRLLEPEPILHAPKRPTVIGG